MTPALRGSSFIRMAAARSTLTIGQPLGRGVGLHPGIDLDDAVLGPGQEIFAPLQPLLVFGALVLQRLHALVDPGLQLLQFLRLQA